MRNLIRLLALIMCAAIIGESIMLWTATGRRGFTFIPSPELAELRKQDGSLTSLFDTPESPTALPPIKNDFALGLFPAGMGAELVSVSTLCTPAMLLGLVAFFRGRATQGARTKP